MPNNSYREGTFGAKLAAQAKQNNQVISETLFYLLCIPSDSNHYNKRWFNDNGYTVEELEEKYDGQTYKSLMVLNDKKNIHSLLQDLLYNSDEESCFYTIFKNDVVTITFRGGNEYRVGKWKKLGIGKKPKKHNYFMFDNHYCKIG